MLNHKGTEKLETKRLILRKFRMEDYLAMYNNWACEDIVTKFLTWPTHSNSEVTKSVLTDWINNYSKKDYYNWAIELKSEKTIIGNISVVNYREETMSAILGYCMGSKWWGNGIMPEAASAVLKYLFEEVGFNRITAKHDVNNPHSGGVMKNAGMQYEGTNRQAGINQQGICDIATYAILKQDYFR